MHTLLSALPKDIAGQLHGLALDGTSGTVLLCDTELTPVSSALLYHDQRALRQAGQLRILAPDGGAPPTLARFLWLTQQNCIDSAAWFLHQADWLTALLSGQPGISDYHNALKTGYDAEHLCWPDWVRALPHAHLLPKVLSPGDIVGNIRPDIAAHFGIHPQCVVHAGTTDSNAAFIATGSNELGTGVTSLGSTLVLKQLSPHRIEALENGVYSHRFGDLWLVGGASNAGAGVLRQYFDDAQLASLSEQINPLLDSPLDYYPLNRVGERFPVNDAHLAPRVGTRPSGTAGSDAEFLHGLLQGLARIEVAGYARLAELGAPKLTHVVTCGGGAKNIMWEKMRARLIGVPIRAALHSEAAYGSALLCRGDHWRKMALS